MAFLRTLSSNMCRVLPSAPFRNFSEFRAGIDFPFNLPRKRIEWIPDPSCSCKYLKPINELGAVIGENLKLEPLQGSQWSLKRVRNWHVPQYCLCKKETDKLVEMVKPSAKELSDGCPSSDPCVCIKEPSRKGSPPEEEVLEVCPSLAPYYLPPDQVEIQKMLFDLEMNPKQIQPLGLIKWALDRGAITLEHFKLYESVDFFLRFEQALVDGKTAGIFRDLISRPSTPRPCRLSDPGVHEGIDWIHQVILLEFCWSEIKAGAELATDPENRSAGCPLLHWAYKSGAISEEELRDYLFLWNEQNLTKVERSFREKINKKIIRWLAP